MGTLAAIEPLLVLELPLTLVGARWFLRGRLGHREWAAIGVMTAGTFGLIAFLGPSNGRDAGIGWLLWVLAIVATVLPIGALFWLGYRSSSPGRRAALLGVGAGLGFGLAAALVKGMTAQYASGGLSGVITSWQLYAAGLAGAFAFWLNQNAINAGRLAAAQPGVTLADPYVSIIWGALVFDEPMRGGPWVAAAVVCGLAMSAGAFVLARSPVISGPQGDSEDGGEAGEDGGEAGEDGGEAGADGGEGGQHGTETAARSGGRSQRRQR
jgi:drug/metabolite transporter (DMT)-like permease